MARYAFHFSTAGNSVPLDAPIDFPGIREALIAANHAARRLVSRQLRGMQKAHGRIDILDEDRKPAAQILLTEVARQISRSDAAPSR